MELTVVAMGVAEILLVTLVLRGSRRRRGRSKQRWRSRLLQMRVNCNEQPLLYTIGAAAQRRQLGISSELVELTFADPAAVDARRGQALSAYKRDVGSRRLKVWIAELRPDRPPLVTKIEAERLATTRMFLNSIGARWGLGRHSRRRLDE